MLKHKAFRRK